MQVVLFHFDALRDRLRTSSTQSTPLGSWGGQQKKTYIRELITRGALQIQNLFEVGKKSKKGDIIYHSVDKSFPKFGFFCLENMYMLLYYL